jgi:hypothetical protein
MSLLNQKKGKDKGGGKGGKSKPSGNNGKGSQFIAQKLSNSNPKTGKTLPSSGSRGS